MSERTIQLSLKKFLKKCFLGENKHISQVQAISHHNTPPHKAFHKLVCVCVYCTSLLVLQGAVQCELKWRGVQPRLLQLSAVAADLLHGL